MKTLAIAATCLLALAACKSPDEQKFAQCEDFIKTKGNNLKVFSPVIESKKVQPTAEGVNVYLLNVKYDTPPVFTYATYACKFEADGTIKASVKPFGDKEFQKL
jgi:hypothetical protein